MHAETLNCPMCGAAASTDATRCLFCDARLATLACPSCFGMMFTGNQYCPRCGAQARREEEEETAADAPMRCPRCRVEMSAVAVGTARMRECARCGGLWVNVATFERICADREQQSVVLGTASPAPTKGGSHDAPGKVRYIPCPECGQLMNRVNFAHCSGVVVDICKGHGTWFDRDELAEIVGFIRGGGLEAARAIEKRQLADERRLLRQEQLTKAAATDYSHSGAGDPEATESGIVSAASSLIKLLLD
ncbi:MAG TPA: zf-TFIIB domain-containing protein [Pyrinomonadaceae bacterium]|nr:zf-TFIIB domain-containing protein [Pyrinomonadaceae bacterium]